ncbi:transglutaminase domain-containing protein [Lentzea flaviverrucosa]|uniref:Transglutaminase-like superfamily protein n=1 Tax=Lentzea flaviverrucosa TaxID=200379 RepID=A0A1H9W6Q5_9PSEU|nr:transglutaminase domain-containing protein [Lentzea flaviverrucosa]RDI22344.1 transglutaminase superfamily protein [Lentzea flaviverrucosa]SES29602.1 Transglutaminase-like superfamily protein [Lentzea flaviverrucosa]
MNGSLLKYGWVTAVLLVGALQLSQAWDGATIYFGLAALAGFAALPLKRIVPGGLAALAVMVLALTGGFFLARGASPDRDPTWVLLDTVPRLLTAARPAPATPELLVPGLLLIIGVSTAMVLSVTKRGTALFVPALGAATLYVSAALLTTGRADRYGLVALTLVVVLALGWLIIDRRGPVVPPAVLATALAALTLLAFVLPSNGFEPRKLVTPPVTDIAISNPLPQLAAWAAQGDAELFRMRGPEVPVRLVTLSRYSGASWEAASTYGPLGVVDAPDLPTGGKFQDASVDLRITGLQGEWLPGVGKPQAVSLSDAMVDPDTGSLVVAEGLKAGLSYTVRGVVETPADTDLAEAQVPAAATKYTALPRLPFTLAEYARQATQNARTPYEKAVALEQVVRLNRRPDAEAPVGSSYARLETFLFGAAGESGAGAGTAEQFASAYAVLARSVGLPTRVVVGFQPVPEQNGERIVRAADATAWPEVYFSGWGWVAFDPVSGNGSGPSAASKREVLNRLASTTAKPAPTSLASVPPLVQPTAVRDDQAAAPQSPKGFPFWAFTPLLVLAALFVARTSRRVRLRAAGPVGAWNEVLDSLQLAGLRPKPSRTVPDVGGEWGEAGARLAVLVDQAAFAPSPVQRENSWQLARQVKKAVRRKASWWRKVVWAIDPRPLFRR